MNAKALSLRSLQVHLKVAIVALCMAVALFAMPHPAQAAQLNESQIQAIVGLLQSFDVDTATVSRVNSILRGTNTGDSSRHGTFSVSAPTAERSFSPGDTLAISWNDTTATAATRYHIVLWPSTYPTGAGWPIAGSGYGLSDATSLGFSWIVDSRPGVGSYIVRVCRIGEDICGVSRTIRITAQTTNTNTTTTTNTTPLSQPYMHGYVCSTDNTQVTLAWDSVSNAGGNATAYPLRVDDQALSCSGPLVGSAGNTGCVTDSTGSTEYVRGNPGTDTSTWATVNITPNTNYKWWVHAYNANGWSAYTKVPFSCSSTNTAGSYSLSIAYSSGNDVVLQASIFPSGATCQANYTIDFGDGSTPVSKTAAEAGCNSMLRAWPSHTYPTSSTAHTYTAKLMTGTTQLATKSVTIAATTQQVNGSCGSANGTTVSSAPSSNLCSAGTASSVVGTGPWNWVCSSNSGTTAACVASKTVTANTAPTCDVTSSAASVKTGTAVTFTVTKQNTTSATFSPADGIVAWGTDDSKTMIFNTTGGRDVSWSLAGAGGTGFCAKHVDIIADTSASSGTNPYTPAGLTASCSGTQATLRWNAVVGAYPATSYALRVNDTTNDASGCSAPTVSGTGGTCYSPTDYINDNAAIGTVVTVPAGKAISWWVHATNGSGWSGAKAGSFTCGTQANAQNFDYLSAYSEAFNQNMAAVAVGIVDIPLNILTDALGDLFYYAGIY